MTERADLEILLASPVPLVTIQTFEEERTVELVKSIAKKLDHPVAKWTITDGLKSLTKHAQFSANDLRLAGEDAAVSATQEASSSRDPETALRAIRNGSRPGFYLLVDLHPFLDEPVHIRLLKEIAHACEKNHQKLIFISHELSLPSELSRFCANFSLSVPTPMEIGRIIAEEAAIWNVKPGAARIRADKQAVTALINNLSGLTRSDVRRLVRNAIHQDGAITADDVAGVTSAKRELIGQDGLLSYEFDTASMSEVGGFANLKQWLSRRQKSFSAAAQGRADRPKGIMLLGVQGGGKSLAAKAVAGIWNVPLLRLDFGVLYNKFFGETERNIRSALSTAEALAPCVLWCDEIEKGISTGDYDSGTSKRVLGTLLTWMAENQRPVFIVATANDISALPPELMRKGRLDEIFFVDLPGASIREEIFTIHLNKRTLDVAQFDVAALATASDGFTGAEIEQAVVSSCYSAQAEDATIGTQHVLAEINATRPLSVVMAEDIQRLRDWARERTVSAS
jgi:hypothetical protein